MKVNIPDLMSLTTARPLADPFLADSLLFALLGENCMLIFSLCRYLASSTLYAYTRLYVMHVLLNTITGAKHAPETLLHGGYDSSPRSVT
jgi:hypothetical protein